ncbi:MAG: hypothetical protein A2Z25_22280 [Planctomycetes bacterium RBG_16_55_9]|nr:MAG: hypothetical protein A2Z25_22280 [Planctomycetes bacterium RBG_16_55_9]
MTEKKATSRPKARRSTQNRNMHWPYIFVPFVILGLGFLFGSYIEIRFDHWPPIVTFRGPPPTPLQRPILQKMVSKSSFDKLQAKHDNLLNEYTNLEKDFREFRENAVEVCLLPDQVQGRPDEVILKVRRLVEYCGTIWYCCAVIATEIAQKISIDTNSESEDENTKEAFKSIQICLNKIGYCNGPINCDWRKTNLAVLSFQKNCCPPDDGKVGIRTWLAMFIKISQEIYGEKESH